MSTLLIVLLFVALLVVGVPFLLLVISWIKSYNRVGIVYREVGDNPSHAQRSIRNFKMTSMKGLGQYIKFFFGGRAFPESKSFSSKNWYYIREGRKVRVGLPFYLQRDNYRPLELDEEAGVLVVKNVDSREFKLRKLIHKHGMSENNKLYLQVTLLFFLFLVVLVVVYALTTYYLTIDVSQKVVQGAVGVVS